MKNTWKMGQNLMISHKFPQTYEGNKGQTLVETALAIFIIFALVFGIVAFGRAMYIKNMLNNASRSAARVAAVTSSIQGAGYANLTLAKGSCNYSNPTGDDAVYSSVCSNLFYIDKSKVTVQIEVNGSTSLAAGAGSGVPITVRTRVDLSQDPILSLLKNVRYLTGNIPNTLAGDASMRYEQ
jgi:Flp pilus assembly protein TadG